MGHNLPLRILTGRFRSNFARQSLPPLTGQIAVALLQFIKLSFQKLGDLFPGFKRHKPAPAEDPTSAAHLNPICPSQNSGG